MSILPVLGLPRIGATQRANFRKVFREADWNAVLPGGRIINGTLTRDAGNGSTPQFVRAGKVFGKITSSGFYAPSIIGLTGGALTSAGTTLTTSAAIATELVRRIGSTGTFKLTGPPTASGTVRTLTATYSAANVTTGDVTITALGVNEVQTLTPTGDGSAGSWTIELTRADGTVWTTGPLAFSASIATIQTALDIATGVANGIVVAGSGAPVDIPNAMTLTFSGTGYAALPQSLVRVIAGTSITGNTGWNVTRTTAGVDGRFVTSSIIGPTDGSESPLTFLPDGFPMQVVDGQGASQNQSFPMLPIAGVVDPANLVDYPADASLRTWLQQQLSSLVGGKYVFGSIF